MPSDAQVLVVSDIHYAGDAERTRPGYETRALRNPVQRGFLRAYRSVIWKRDPFAHNHTLDQFLSAAQTPDLVVANGDYSCDTAFVGVSDDAALASARTCLDQLRRRFGGAFVAILGDHEVGKLSLFGRQGGLRLASYRRATGWLGIDPFWRRDLGAYTLLGVASSLLAFPVFEPESLPEERSEWRRLREAHLQTITETFTRLDPARRVILFCHDPTALPYLWEEPVVRARLRQIELTVIGHLHSSLILWKSRLLAGMPVIPILGNAVRRMSHALREARKWALFNVRLCPALSGIELLKDGGYGQLDLDRAGVRPARYAIRPLC